MKFIKKYETETAFEAEKEDLISPWVALSLDDFTVHYDMSFGEPAVPEGYVDLGLPSGTLWATCNLGASAPTDYGKYFQWGDTVGYTDASHSTWATAPFNNGSSDFDSTYFDAHKSEWLDGDVLKSEYDAAYQATNGVAHIPTKEQIQELIDNTTSEYIENGMRGMKFTSSNGNSIFIPSAGYIYDGYFNGEYWNGQVQSCSLYSSYPREAFYLYSNNDNVYVDHNLRCSGRSVRPVIG